jgi:hypothetical protein
MDGLHQIRIYGEPQPFPKKETAIVQTKHGKPRLIPVDRDYRTRTDPETGRKVKYDRGHKRAWMDHVAKSVLAYMAEKGLDEFPQHHPVAIGTLFFVTQANGNKLPLPAQKPDEDNLDYAIKNALSAQKDRPGLYHDDCQVVMRLMPSGMIWATKEEPPGVLITFADFYDVHDQLGEFDPLKEFSKQEELI